MIYDSESANSRDPLPCIYKGSMYVLFRYSSTFSTTMANLINLAHGTCADLSRAAADGLVIGYQINGNQNQQWANVGGTIRSAVIAGGAPVMVGVQQIPVGNDPQVYGGGPENQFVINFVPGGIMIQLAGTNLFWTLVNNFNSTPVRVLPRIGPVDGPQDPSQVWNIV